MRLRHIQGAEETIASSPFVIQEPEQHRGTWNQVFGGSHPLEIEVGMGKGRFIMEKASANPDINYIGIEKFPSVMVGAIKKIDQLEKIPSNLKLLKEDAILLTEVFGKHEVNRIYLNFSDPWPKSKHAKRRLTSSKFLDVYKDILIDEGNIEFKSDNRGLFEYSIISLNQYPMDIEYISLDLHNSPESEINIMTEYERKFCEKGPIYKLVARYRKNG